MLEDVLVDINILHDQHQTHSLHLCQLLYCDVDPGDAGDNEAVMEMLCEMLAHNTHSSYFLLTD